MMRYNIRALVLLVCMTALGSAVQAAMLIDSNAGISLAFTDNAGLTETNEADDIITTGSLTASVSEDTGPVTGNARASIRYLDYQENTFGNQTYFQLDSAATWEPIPDRLEVRAQDYYQQTSIDSLSTGVPLNTEDTNVFDLAATATLPVADRHTLRVTPSFDDYYYETTNNDNQQLGIAVAWDYQLNRFVRLSLGAGFRDVDYESQFDLQRTSYNLTAEITRQRTKYTLTAGIADVERDQGAGSDGVTGTFTLEHEFTPKSSIVAYASSDITDASTSFLSSSANPTTGSFSNIQVSSDIVRDNVFRLSYTRSGTVAGANAWIELRDVDYTTDAFDREVQEVGASLTYGFTPRVNGSIDARYVERDDTDITRTDKTTSLAGQLFFSLSRKLNANVGARLASRDSSAAGSSYDELAFMAGISYRLTR